VTVLDLQAAVAARAATVSAAQTMHPSRPGTALPWVDRAASLEALARNWEAACDLLNSGPDAIGDDEAHETLQVLASALVHPAAASSLIFTLPGLLAAVRQNDRVRDGDLDPHDINDCRTIEEALEHTQHAIRCELYPLVQGRPLRDACHRCIPLIHDVTHWPTSRDCDVHGRAL
jgi:hypothetical protein